MPDTSQASRSLALTSKTLGLLLEPFTWAAPSLATILHASSEYLFNLIYLTLRMHLIGLALSHVAGTPNAELTGILFRGIGTDGSECLHWHAFGWLTRVRIPTKSSRRTDIKVAR